jgi:hypothetical protein
MDILRQVPVDSQWLAMCNLTKALLHIASSALLPKILRLIPFLFLMQPSPPLSSSHTQSLLQVPSNPPQPMPSKPPQAHSPEVSAACCLTAALSRLKALSAGPSRPFAPMPEDQRRAAVLRKADSANGARVAVRRPSIVSCVVVGVESGGCEASAGSSASTAVGVGRSRGCSSEHAAFRGPSCDEIFAGRENACTVCFLGCHYSELYISILLDEWTSEETSSLHIMMMVRRVHCFQDTHNNFSFDRMRWLVMDVGQLSRYMSRV